MKILIISKFYPPEGSARAIQMSKVVASLVRHKDCEVQVLAGLSAEHKPVSFDYPVKYVGYKKWSSNAGLGLFGRLKIAKQNLKLTSDWIKQATKAGVKILETFKPDIILSASNPLDCHQVAMNIQKKKALPWVSFFSDITPPSIAPWPYFAKTKLTNFLWLRTLRKITLQTLKKSNAIIMSNDLAVEYMAEKLNVNIAAKSFAVPHVGDVFEKKLSSQIPSELLEGRIVHIGLIDSARSCPELLDAARSLHKEMPEKFKGLIFVGNVVEDFVNLTTEQERESLFLFVGKVTPAMANEYISQARSLLLVEADMASSPYLPSKMAEYSVNGDNIIAITPPVSPIRQYIEKYGGGYCASRNIDEIEKALRQASASDKTDRVNPLAKIFTSDQIAESYYKVFEDVLRV